MKKIAKITSAIMMTFVMILSIAGCGLDMSKVKGDWTLDTINGQSLDDYAAGYGTTAAACAVNMTVSDREVVIANTNSSQTYSIQVKSNGFEVLNPSDNKTVFMSVTYDASAETLSYSLTDGQTEQKFVFKKGTVDLAAAVADEAPVDEAPVDEAEAPADEEYTDEEYSDEEYSDEEYIEE